MVDYSGLSVNESIQNLLDGMTHQEFKDAEESGFILSTTKAASELLCSRQNVDQHFNSGALPYGILVVGDKHFRYTTRDAIAEYKSRHGA